MSLECHKCRGGAPGVSLECWCGSTMSRGDVRHELRGIPLQEPALGMGCR